MPATAEIRSVTLDKLTPDPDQVRKNFDKASIATLAANIKARGILVPLRARQLGKKLVIVDGERRYRAAKVAKLKAVPVIVVDDSDDVQRSLDQVAMNSLREPLKPLELGRLLVSLRKDHKLSDNQIAAHLDKQGIPALSKGQMKELMALVDLPPWAQEMVGENQMTAKVATVLHDVKEPKVLAAVGKRLANALGYRGRVESNDVTDAIRGAYEQDPGSRDLRKSYGYSKADQELVVHFDTLKACKGCEHLRVFAHTRICRNPKHFEELNAQAKEAGLLPGGKTPQKAEKPAGPGPKETEVIAAHKAERQIDKLRHLVQAVLQTHIVRDVLGAQPEIRESLVYWLAARQPDGWRYGRQAFSDSRHRAIDIAVEASPLKSLTAFLKMDPPGMLKIHNALAEAAVMAMSWPQVQTLALHLDLDIAKVFTVDAEYLALQSLDQLKELGRMGHIGEANKMTGKALRGAILDSPDALAKIGVPADVMQVYSDLPEPEPEYDDDIEDAEIDEDEDTGEDTPIEEQEDEAA